MGIFGMEFYKVFARRQFILVVLFLAAANAALFYTNQSNPMVGPQEYKKVYAHLKELPPLERADYIRDGYEAFCGEGGKKDTDMGLSRDQAYFLYQELYGQLKQIEDYPKYLKDIRERAEHAGRISIFSRKDPFSVRNAKKTAEAFLPLEGTVLQFTNTRTVVEATGFTATDFFLVALYFYIVVLLVFREKEKGLFALVKPLVRGRAHFICAKAGVLLVFVCLFTLLFWGGNLLLASFQYGAADPGARLQSVGGYAGSALNVTVLQYWLLFLVSKMAVYTQIGLLFFYFALKADSAAMLYVRSVFLFAVSFALYWAVDGNSALGIFKYMNLVNFVQVTPIYQYYFNLNLFAVPVSIGVVFAVSCAVFCPVLFFLGLYNFKTRDLAPVTKRRFFFGRSEKERCHTSLLYHEAYKLFIVQKAFWILVFFLCFQGYLFMQKPSYIGEEERYYKNYMQTLGGKVTDRTHALIEKEEERLQSFVRMRTEAEQAYENGNLSQKEYDAVQKLADENTRSQGAFARVQEHFAYVLEQGRKTGEIPFMVYETGYEKLTGHSYTGYEEEMNQAAVVLIAMIAAFSALFAAEYSAGMDQILSCYRLGRSQTVKAKLRAAYPLCTAFFVLGYAPDFVAVCSQYGLPFGNARLSSVPALAGLPETLTLWQYLALLYLFRYLVYCSILLLVFLVSAILKDNGTALLVLSVALAVPAILHRIGLRWADSVSLNAFVSGNMLLNRFPGGGFVMLPLFAAGLWIFCYRRLLFVYGKEPY